MVALTALSNVLQTVTANPDPQDAIKKQGGLAELTGAVARQALVLPDPIDDWLGGIASDTSGLTEKAVTSELNAIWRADILPFCQAALNNRYPFTAESAVDVNVKDFARLVRPRRPDRRLHQRPSDQLCRYDQPSRGSGAPISA